MKNNTRILIYPLLLLGVLLMFTSSCKKEDDILPPILFNPDLTYGSVTDIDGNVYKTITIGTQTWMAENLKTSKYCNGELIPNVVSFAEWASLITGGYCYYDNEPKNARTYGMLYNWYTANDSRKLAPAGWHIPTNDEWTTLIDYLGGKDTAGVKLMETGSIHWNLPSNKEATNETGFTALPSGVHSVGSLGNNFVGLGGDSYFWSLTQDNTYNAWSQKIGISSRFFLHDKCCGFSVRCVKDN